MPIFSINREFQKKNAPKDLQLPGIHPTKLEKYKALIKKHLLEDESLGAPTKGYSEATSIALGQQLISEKSNSCNNHPLDLSQVILGFNEQVLIEDNDLIGYNEQLALSEERSDCHSHFNAFIQEKLDSLYKKDEHYIDKTQTAPKINPTTACVKLCALKAITFLSLKAYSDRRLQDAQDRFAAGFAG